MLPSASARLSDWRAHKSPLCRGTLRPGLEDPAGPTGETIERFPHHVHLNLSEPALMNDRVHIKAEKRTRGRNEPGAKDRGN